MVAYIVKKSRKYRRKRGLDQDPIVTQLKRESKLIKYKKPLKSILVRGGQIVSYSTSFKNKLLARLVRILIYRKQLKLLRQFLALMNGLISTNLGLRLALGGTLDYTQIILIGVPTALGSFLIGLANVVPPFVGILLPLGILYGRDRLLQFLV